MPSDTAKQHWRQLATMIGESDQTLNLIYKIFFKLGSVSFVLSKYPQLWRRFFSFGALDVM